MADLDDPIPIIDPHQHLWDLKRFKLPWLPPALDRSYLLSDYRKAAEGLHVVKTVYMEVGVDSAQRQDEAEYVLGLCADPETAMAGAVIAGDPASAEFRDYLKQKKDSPLKGVRAPVPDMDDGKVHPEFIKGVRLLGDLGMRFDLNTELGKADAVAVACPHTPFVLDHCGGADLKAADRGPWERGIAKISARKNVICKISGVIATAPNGKWSVSNLEPIVLHVLKHFGPDRCIFAGDWPVCTLAASLRQWVEALQSILRDQSPADRRKIFHDNAAKFYAV